MTAHQISLGAINVQARNPTALARFWGSVTGADPGTGSDSIFLPAAGSDGFAMFSTKVSSTGQTTRWPTSTSLSHGDHEGQRSSV